MAKSTDRSVITKKSSVLQSALAMSAGTMTSRILGLVRDMLLTAFFTTKVTDAFLAAFKLPNLFRRILGEGSLSVSFIPVYLDTQTKDGTEASKELAGSLWSILMLVAASLSCLAVIFMDDIFPFIIQGKGFSGVPGKVELSVFLARFMFSYLFLVTSYAFLMALANAHKYFFVPALGPTAFNLTFIIFALCSYQFKMLEGKLLAIGVLAGGVFQLLLVFVYLYKKSLVPKLKWNLNAKGLSTTLKNMLPGMIGFGIVQYLGIINLYFASLLDEGALSFIYIADRILELPQSLIAISLGSALLPTLSKLWSEGNKKKFLSESLKYQKLLVYMAIPCCIGMFVLAKPIIQTLFQRGEFGLDKVNTTVIVLQIYSVLLLASSLNKVLIPNLYAIKNTWLPAVITVVSLLLHICMAHFYFVEAMGLRGLVLSTTIAGFLNMFLILMSCNILVGKMQVSGLFVTLIKSLALAAAMGVAVYYLSSLINMDDMNSILRAVILFVIISAGALVYGLLSILFKVDEFTQVKKLLRR